LRKLVALVFVLVVLAGILGVADVIIRRGVEDSVADRIETFTPGSHATVKISSFPFLGRLAVSGTVPKLRADVTGVTAGSLSLGPVDLTVTNLKLNRHELFRGEVQAVSIGAGEVVVEVPQSSFDAFVHLPLTLGRNTVGVGGVKVTVHPVVADGTVTIHPTLRLPSLRLSVPELDILPCVSAAQVVPGAVRLSCHFTTIPGLLQGTFRL
jgi:hypothetical protein